MRNAIQSNQHKLLVNYNDMNAFVNVHDMCIYAVVFYATTTREKVACWSVLLCPHAWLLLYVTITNLLAQ